MLLDVHAGGRAWRSQGVTADQVLSKVTLIEDGSATLGRFARGLIEQAVAEFSASRRPAPAPDTSAPGGPAAGG